MATLVLAACASGATRFTGLQATASASSTRAPSSSPLIGGSPPGASHTTSVEPGPSLDIKGFAFLPATIAIGVGTVVTWTNLDLVAHTVTSDAGLFDSGLMQNRQAFQWTFDTAGTFSYICTIHPSMVATITVSG